MIKDILTGLILLFGALFAFLAAVGLVRLPDFFSRMQASTKAQTLGLMCILLGLAIHFQDLGVTTRALLVLLFVFVTSPIAAHMIARAAYLLRIPIWEGTKVDEMAEKYDYERRTLAGWRPPHPSERDRPG
jgi:multicomponent Na+:H+ antiporter subunit G